MTLHPVALALLILVVHLNGVHPTRSPRLATVKMIGCFSDVKASGEHAKGYSVRLWSSGTDWFGVVDRYEGPSFDPPMGVLDEIRYTDSTGAVSFKAKMTFGFGASGPTRQLVVFVGRLDGDSLVGNFEIEHLDAPPTWRLQRETVVLQRTRVLCDDRTFADRAEWWRFYEPMVRARGAKW